MLKIFGIFVIVPLALIGFFMVIESIAKVLGKPTVDEEWQDIHVDSNMNHGQGPLKEDK